MGRAPLSAGGRRLSPAALLFALSLSLLLRLSQPAAVPTFAFTVKPRPDVSLTYARDDYNTKFRWQLEALADIDADRTFGELDSSGDGSLAGPEVGALKALLERLEREAKEELQNADLTESDFTDRYSPWIRKSKEWTPHRVFGELDKNGNGLIDSVEVRKIGDWLERDAVSRGVPKREL